MRMASPPLWTLTLITRPETADYFADVIGEEALAVSVSIPPRQKQAKIEAIFDEEPRGSEWGARMAIAAMMAGFDEPVMAVQAIPRLDWLKKVAGDFPPLPIGRWIVHGRHHREAVPNRLRALQIDATSAFGTGEHPTTRGCLMFLDALLKKRPVATLLDMGCGTGILAIAAGKSGRTRTVGVDMDPTSVLIAKGNAQVNRAAYKSSWHCGMAYRPHAVRKKAPYDLIMANIFARPLMTMAKDARRHLRPGGHMILAGLLNHQANGVIAAHRMQRIYVQRRRVLGEWTILSMKRPRKPVLDSM